MVLHMFYPPGKNVEKCQTNVHRNTGLGECQNQSTGYLKPVSEQCQNKTRESKSP